MSATTVEAEDCGSMASVVVFVKNLDRQVEEDVLREHFSVFGNVMSCEIPQGKRGSKCYGFVTFDTESSAQAAIAGTNGKELFGKSLATSHYTSKENRDSLPDHVHPVYSCLTSSSHRTVYIKNLSPTIDALFLKITCSPYGEVSNVKIIRDANGVSKGFAFVTFRQVEQATKAIEEINGKELDGKVLFAGPAIKKAARRRQQQQQQHHQHHHLHHQLDPSQNPEREEQSGTIATPQNVNMGTTKLSDENHLQATLHQKSPCMVFLESFTGHEQQQQQQQRQKQQPKQHHHHHHQQQRQELSARENNEDESHGFEGHHKHQIYNKKNTNACPENLAGAIPPLQSYQVRTREAVNCHELSPIQPNSKRTSPSLPKLKNQQSCQELHLPKIDTHQNFHSPPQRRKLHSHNKGVHSVSKLSLDRDSRERNGFDQKKQHRTSFSKQQEKLAEAGGIYLQGQRYSRTRSLSLQRIFHRQKQTAHHHVVAETRKVGNMVEGRQNPLQDRNRKSCPIKSFESSASPVGRENNPSRIEQELSIHSEQQCVQEKEEHDENLEKDTQLPHPPAQGVNLYVKHLDDSVDDVILKDMFSKFGEVISAKVMMEGDKSRGFGFVCFVKAEDAARATRDMRRNVDDTSRKPLYVAPAQRKEERQAFFREKLKVKQADVKTGEDGSLRKITYSVEQSKDSDSDSLGIPRKKILDSSLSTLQTMAGGSQHRPPKLLIPVNERCLNDKTHQAQSPLQTKISNVARIFPRRQKRKLLSLECFNLDKLRTPLIKPTRIENANNCVQNTFLGGSDIEGNSNQTKAKLTQPLSFNSLTPLPSLCTFVSPQSPEKAKFRPQIGSSSGPQKQTRRQISTMDLSDLEGVNIRRHGKNTGLTPIGCKPAKLSRSVRLPNISISKDFIKKQGDSVTHSEKVNDIAPIKQASFTVSLNRFSSQTSVKSDQLTSFSSERSWVGQRTNDNLSDRHSCFTAMAAASVDTVNLTQRLIPSTGAPSRLHDDNQSLLDDTETVQDSLVNAILPPGIISSEEELTNNFEKPPLKEFPHLEPLVESEVYKRNTCIPQRKKDIETIHKDTNYTPEHSCFHVQDVMHTVPKLSETNNGLAQVSLSQNIDVFQNPEKTELYLNTAGFQDTEMLQDSGFQEISEPVLMVPQGMKCHNEPRQFPIETVQCFSMPYEATHTCTCDHEQHAAAVLFPGDIDAANCAEPSSWYSQNYSQRKLNSLPPMRDFTYKISQDIRYSFCKPYF